MSTGIRETTDITRDITVDVYVGNKRANKRIVTTTDREAQARKYISKNYGDNVKIVRVWHGDRVGLYWIG